MATRNKTLRPGNKSLENIVGTDERYGHDGLWLGPPGLDSGRLLEHPKPYRIANLCPDQNSSDWLATVQAGKDGYVQMVYRVYLPDVNRDGSGDVGLPKYEAGLADGTRNQRNRPMSQGVASGMTVEQWRALCNARDNDPELKPQATPARNSPVMESS